MAQSLLHGKNNPSHADGVDGRVFLRVGHGQVVLGVVIVEVGVLESTNGVELEEAMSGQFGSPEKACWIRYTDSIMSRTIWIIGGVVAVLAIAGTATYVAVHQSVTTEPAPSIATVAEIDSIPEVSTAEPVAQEPTAEMVGSPQTETKTVFPTKSPATEEPATGVVSTPQTETKTPIVTESPSATAAPSTDIPASESSDSSDQPSNNEAAHEESDSRTPDEDEPGQGSEPTAPAAPSSEPPQPSPPSQSSTPSCSSNTSPTFTHHVTDLTKVSKVVSPPTKAGTDLKPHGYLDTQLNSVPVYVPMAATLDSGAYYQEGNPGGEYLLIFKASCEVTFRFDHITSPVQSIRDAFPTLQSDTRTSQPSTTVTFTAGEQIATTTGTVYGIWDFGVYNSSTSNRYANDPDWNWSSNATTAVCPWGYYSVSMYAQVQTLFGSLGGNPADGEPFCS